MNRYTLLLLLAAAVPSDLLAQATEGSILGTVVDKTGAGVAGVQITVTNTLTNFPRTTVTSAIGEYVVSNLPLGSYQVSAQMTGFKKAVHPAVEMTVKARLRVDLMLEIGELTQQVEVAGETPALKTDTAEVSTLISRQQIESLPSQNRHFLSLSVLTPGTYRQWTAGGGDRVGDFSGGESVVVNGLNSGQNNFILDGVSNNIELTGGLNAIPPSDAIQEVSFQTSSYSAEFGRSGGAVVNVALRSGTNTLHGFGYDYLQNDKINASPYDYSGTHPAKPPLRRNVFGGGLSGPIKKNKIFFFGNYEGMRQPSSVIEYDVVPTAAERIGDFSKSGWTVYDPQTTNAAGARTPFPNNIIPNERINPLMRKLIGIYPVPNYTDPNPAVLNNYLALVRNVDNRDSMNIKGDVNLSSNDTFTMRYTKQWFSKDRSGFIPGNWIGGRGTLNGTNVGLTETHVFSPHVVNEARIGWNYIVDGNTILNSTTIEELATIPGAIVRPGYPDISMRNITRTRAIRPLTTLPNPYQVWQSSFQYMDNVSWHKGAHAIKAGIAYTHDRNDVSGNNPAGGIKFSTDGFATTATVGGARPARLTGLADALLGQINQLTTYFAADKTRMRDKRLALFVQDDWRVTRKLSLSIGLRYEYFPNWSVVNDFVTNFNLSTGKIQVPETTRGFVQNTLGLPGGNLPSNYEYLPLDQVKPKNISKDFSPRLGFAYSITKRLVLRGGYGIFYTAIQALDMNNTAGAPFNGNIQLIGDTRNAVPLSAGFPAGSFYDTLASSGIPMAAFEHRYKDPYVQKYGMSLQAQVLPKTTVEIGYSGNHAIRLDDTWRINHPKPGPGDIQSRRPYPLLGEGFGVEFRGYSHYNGMELTVRQQLTHGLTVFSALTIQHSYGTNTLLGLDPYNFDYGYGTLSTDYGKQWTTSVIYEVPYRMSFPRIVRNTLGGWQASSIIQFRGGLPFSIASSQTMNDNLNASRADLILTNGPAALPTSERTINRWFNTAAFATPANYTYGNSGYNILRGPGFSEVQLAVQKTFNISESKKLTFRGEAQNAFNRVNRGLPASTLGSSGFGAIRSLAGDPRLMQMLLKLSF